MKSTTIGQLASLGCALVVGCGSADTVDPSGAPSPTNEVDEGLRAETVTTEAVPEKTTEAVPEGVVFHRTRRPGAAGHEASVPAAPAASATTSSAAAAPAGAAALP